MASQNNYKSNIKVTDHHNKYNNEKNWNIVSITEMWQSYEMSICCRESDANRLDPHRAATNLQFVENTVSVKYSKMRHACTRNAINIWGTNNAYIFFTELEVSVSHAIFKVSNV